MQRIWVFLLGVFLGSIALSLSAQGPNVLGGGSPNDVTIVVNGKTYLRITRDGVVTLENGAQLAGDFAWTGAPNTFPSGTLRLTDNYAGDGNQRAVFIAKRNSQANGGTPTIGDGIEFLGQLQDSNGNYGNVAGINARLVTVDPSTMKGRLELNAKPSGAYNAAFDEPKMIVDWDGKVGIGEYFGTITNTPASIFNIVSNTTHSASVFLDQSSADTTAASLIGRKSRGTKASPSKTLSGDDILGFAARGYQDVTSAYTGSSAAITMTATEDYTNVANGSKITLAVTPTGSTTRANQMTIAPNAWTIGSMVTPANSGTRFLCISTTGVVTSSASACSGT